MDQIVRKIVEHIFSHWTALQLAVEHGMGGPDSKKIAIDTVDYVTNYLLSESNVESEDIADVLEDIMNDQFNTVCEDNSIREISYLLIRFMTLLKEGNTAQAEIEYNNLPVGKEWLSKSQEQPAPKVETTNVINGFIEEENMATEMPSAPADVDPEWRIVRTRRKR